MSLATMIEDLINDIGTGLNEAAIRNRLLTLREQAEAQDTRLQELEAKVVELEAKTESEKLAPKTERLDEIQEKFLQLLAKHEELTIRQIADGLGISKIIAEHHKDVLYRAEMIHFFGANDEDETLWGLVEKGRSYLVTHGLVK